MSGLKWAFVAAATICSAPAVAGIYGNDLGKCIVEKSTAADKLILARWIFAAMSSSTAVKQLSTVTDKERTVHNREYGELTARLVTVDCRSQFINALKYEGMSAMETSFGILGEVAMRELMGSPEVSAQLNEYADYVNTPAFRAALKEAGIAAPANKTGDK